MAHRKLQQEVDKVFKKINEGLDVFDTYYERHESCTNNPSQKDKLESDLKREVKKLQRLREQIKSWQSSPDIKDKDTLLEHRRRVEIAMEKYKAVEKASKEKAYSNISLKRAETLDPESKERLETENYLSRSIDELDRQYELLDVEIDRLQALNKKKKTFSQLNEEKIQSLKDLQLRYRWHQQQMELALRLVANEELSPQQVINIKDDINYFVENNQDEGFIEDETIYDDLDLQSNEAIAHEVSQYFSNQLSEDNKRANDGTANGISGSSGSSTAINNSENSSLIDTSKLSKKELRKLEREAKKAAKLAAKNAAAESLSQGPTLTVKMSTKPPSPIPHEDIRDTTPTQKTSKTNGSDEKISISTSVNNTSLLATSSPLIKKTTNKSPNTMNDNNTSNDTSINAVHTHIHQGANGVTGSTILKPATIPAKPVGDMKWSTAAAQSLKKDDEKPKNTIKQSSVLSSQQNKIKLNESIQFPLGSTTPRVGTPVSIHNNSVTTNVSLNKIGQLESLTSINTNKSALKTSSASSTATIPTSGATIVNQTNQQFQKGQSATLDQINKSKVETVGRSNNLTNSEQHVINTNNDKISKEKKSDEPDLVTKNEVSETEFDTDSFYDFINDDDELLQEPQCLPETLDEIQTKENKRAQLSNSFSNDCGLLTLPNGINEIIMEYEITKNKLFPNDGKLGGYRHSIDACRIPRFYDIPLGVNPPNPLDAFRSAQQWDVIRTSIKDETEFDKILDKFRGLEMFTLFYHYYFSVLPVEKNIAFELLREKNWKIGNDETMWFLRQSDIKLQSELFEVADYKIFKLTDWSVIDKINFRLDYANLKYPETKKYETSQLNCLASEDLKTKIDSNNINDNNKHNNESIDNTHNNNSTKSSSPNTSSISPASPNTLSHGQQLLQQLKKGRVTLDA